MTTHRASAFVAGTTVTIAGLFGVTLAVVRQLIKDGTHVDAESLLGKTSVASDRGSVRLDDAIGQLGDVLDERLQTFRDLDEVFAKSLDVAFGAPSDAKSQISDGHTKSAEVGSASDVDHAGDCAAGNDSPSDDPTEIDDLELLRAQLVDAMSSESERRWCAGWAKDLERTLHREGGIWETLGRACGWPLGYRGEDGWVTWWEAGILYDDDAEKKVDPTPTPTDLSSAGPIFTSYADRTLTDHLEDLIRVDEILTREFPRTPSRERIRVAIEITGALKWGAL